MGKVFLSHSSKDKEYVSYIAEKFGKDQCVYDAMCFEAGMKNIEEIFREMDKTSIFVVFLSDNSLNSDWVKKELSIADEQISDSHYKLKQIFPIIIDPNINHNDPRIPDFMKRGFGSYNLRVITNKVVAYRKIRLQLNRLKYETNPNCFDDCFYGRDVEIAKFKSAFDTSDGIKCLIASGLTGIGRKSYSVQCLKDSQIVEPYYMPPIISMDAMSSIEDFIIKLCEIGFGIFSLEDIAPLNMNEKIDALVSLLKNIQDYREQVVIYDDNCLITRQRELIYWLEKAIDRIRPEITLIIAAKASMNMFYLKKHQDLFAIDISTLSYKEWSGLMRVYGKRLGIELSTEDRNYFKDIITGYPPQVLYCVDLMKEQSPEAVKKNPRPIVDFFSPKISSMLESAIPAEIKQDAYGLLSFTSAYGIVPTDLLTEIIGIKDAYKRAFSLFKELTICRYLGISNEYVEINPLISDYIQRSKFSLPNDIKTRLNQKIEAIGKTIETEPSIVEDFENLKFYLKSNIISGKSIPQRLMYSTLYLSSIDELYNKQKYKQVISIVEALKDSGAYSRYDVPIQVRIQSFYCLALARETNKKFYTEVEFFKQGPTKDLDEYAFLRGFMYRHESKYDKALEQYKIVLKNNPRRKSAMREIVIVYRGLEDFESAYEYAKINYEREPDNIFQIQPYFEILIRRGDLGRSEEEKHHIAEILETVQKLYTAKPSSTYYEIMAQNAAYEEKNQARAIAILEEGAEKFPDSSFIVKSMFDCNEVFKDIAGMTVALSKLEPFAKSNAAARVAYNIRQVVLYAFQQKPKEFIDNSVDGIVGLNDASKKRLKKKAFGILTNHSSRT